MMNSLFSIFDPATNLSYNFNWISSLLIILNLPLIYWILDSRLTKLFKMLLNLMFNELKIILFNKFNIGSTIYLIALFLIILLNNFMGLFPYIFTSSSHMIFSISFSLPLWLSLMIFGWMKNSNFMFQHMIPQGTPNILMPFMVMIETISNIIRPGTLAIRLTANMIAGHLLLTLMSNSAQSPIFLISMGMISLQTLLLMLEFSVAIIQSYVFTILSTLYTKETN